jgi:hypothetical protein
VKEILVDEDLDDAPNARAEDRDGEVVEYGRVGDVLKFRYSAKRDNRGWAKFNPAYAHVELNGVPIKFCQELKFIFGDGIPKATITVSLEDIDIDSDSLIALKAIVEAKEAKDGV